MKIMKVMYVNPMYDQLEHWSIGDRFVSDWVRGNVSGIFRVDGGYEIYVKVTTPDDDFGYLPALFISNHAVNRIYYGEE